MTAFVWSAARNKINRKLVGDHNTATQNYIISLMMPILSFFPYLPIPQQVRCDGGLLLFMSYTGHMSTTGHIRHRKKKRKNKLSTATPGTSLSAVLFDVQRLDHSAIVFGGDGGNCVGSSSNTQSDSITQIAR